MEELGPAAVGAEHLGTVRQEASTDQRGRTAIADETVAVPMTVVKGNELGASQTCDWSCTPATFLGEQLSKAVCAEWFLVARRKLLPGQQAATLGAGEAVAMPRCVSVGNAALVNHPVALDATLGVVFLVTSNADHFLITWYEAPASHWLLAHLAAKALLVPLLAFILKLLHACSEQTPASVASCGEVVVVTVGAVQPFVLAGKRTVNER